MARMGLLICALLIAGEARAQGRDTTRSRGPVYAVGGALLAAATLDIEMTVTCIRRYQGCNELNPLGRPLFGDAGNRLPPYLAATVGYGSLMLLSNRWRQQGKSYWWVAPAVLTTVHVVAAAKGVHDMRRSRR